MTRMSLSFFAGALVPAVSLYATGGSNRFMFLFGLTLGLVSLLLPTLLWPRKVSNGIWRTAAASEQFLAVLRADRLQAQLPAPVSNLERHILPAEPRKPRVELPAHPFAEDCLSALCNLGAAETSARRTVRELVQSKQYNSLEDLLRDATAATRRR